MRSLARDLGDALGVPAHLTALRRIASGAFSLTDAVAPEEVTADHLLPLEEVASRVLPTRRLTAEGVAHARCGGPMREGDFEHMGEDVPTAWLSPSGELVAIGSQPEGSPARVIRGFRTVEPAQ